jgi:hypothetical protein
MFTPFFCLFGNLLKNLCNGFRVRIKDQHYFGGAGAVRLFSSSSSSSELEVQER